MGDNWKSGNVDGNTRRITRRGILASVSASAVGGLAGCTGGDGSGGNDGGDGSDGGDGGSTGANDGGGSRDSIIPGEAHNDLSGIEVLDHWVEGNWLKVEIQNNRDESFEKIGAGGWRGKERDLVRGLLLTEQGNKLTEDWWRGGNEFGPGEINPDTSAVIGIVNFSSSELENAARYVLCLYRTEGEYELPDWEEVCGE